MDIWSTTNTKIKELLKQFDSSEDQGLSTRALSAAQLRYGKNFGVEDAKPLWIMVLKRQIASPFIYLLLVAAALSYALGHSIDATFIVVFVAINTGLGFYQEYRSEQTIRLLQRHIHGKCLVLRAGVELTIDQYEIVPGDLVLVKEGDILPADIRMIQTHDLEIDESVLSGETLPVAKTISPLKEKVIRVFDASNVGFSGTVVTGGTGTGLVIATGKETVAYRIGAISTQTNHSSGFQKGLASFSKFIVRLIIVTLVIVVLANILMKGSAIGSLSQLLVFAIALAVSAVPEALPVVMTFSFSRGAYRLSRKHAVVKRLSAVEDIGSIDVLCTDKTGTLTENVMSVAKIEAYTKFDPLLMATLASPKPVPGSHQNPFDAAILHAFGKTNAHGLASVKRLSETPFDSKRRFETVVINHRNKLHFIMRGAPEAVAKHCVAMTKKQREAMDYWIKVAGDQGQRVLAIAGKPLTRTVSSSSMSASAGLTLYGLISFADPVKPSTFHAIKQAKVLGMQIKMLTGDRPEVAAAVAVQIALIERPDQVMTGEQLFALPMSEQLRAVESCAVFARVTPEQKYDIIHLLQRTYRVGFLGEGINDVPALKIADVAIVVNEASDVARSAADIVLMRKSLDVIVDAVKEGRIVFANTLKYVRATLSSNLGNFYAVSLASLYLDVLPLLPLQLLLINLLTDFPMILIATDNVDAKEISKPRGYHVKDIALFTMVLGLVSAVFDFISFGVFLHLAPDVLRSNWFMVSVFTELLFLFSVRTHLAFWKSIPSAPLVALSGLAFLVTLILPFTDIGARWFQFVAPQPVHLLVILGIAVAYFITTEIVKLLFFRTMNEH